jgi:hypothetical protein
VQVPDDQPDPLAQSQPDSYRLSEGMLSDGLFWINILNDPALVVNDTINEPEAMERH